MINSSHYPFPFFLLLFGFVFLFCGCSKVEEAHSIDGDLSPSESLIALEEGVLEVYALAPCPTTHEYCSFPFLIEEVDALIAAYCRDGLPQEALRVYDFFEHFKDPSPQPPEC